MRKNKHRLPTLLIHAGEPRPRIEGAVTAPIFQSSTYEFEGEGGAGEELRYLRLSNSPNHRILHRKLAALEGGEDALVLGSGMAAVTGALLGVVASGDHLLAQKGLYGGTHDLIRGLFPGLGIESDLVPGDDPASWEGALRENTRAIYLESVTNPLMEVADFEAVLDFAGRHRLAALVDNTFTSPVNFRPLELGFDLSIHSATKYLNGHSDIVAGAVIGETKRIEKVRKQLILLGSTLDPHSCFLLHRGIKTLALRVGCQNRGGMELAGYLERHPEVERVLYPGLPSHPHHHRASRFFSGYGGMLSFELKGGVRRARRFLAEVRLPMVAPSLGGVESLLTRPAATSHSGLTPREREELGIRDSLIRVSVGIEAVEDLIEDFDTAIGLSRPDG